MIVAGLGVNLHNFYCPGVWLDIRLLRRVSPQILGTLLVEGKLGGSRALRNTIPGFLRPDPGSLRPDSRDPETVTGNLETDT